MASFKKFLRPTAARLYLNKLSDLVGENVPVAIVFNGEPVVSHGRDSDDFPLDKAVSAELIFGSTFVGGVAALPPDGSGESDIEQLGKILDFAALSLQSVVDIEAARRSIADEALAKYREIALLQRAVNEFNNSLQLSDVVNSLLEECAGDDYPGERIIIFLNDPGRGGFRLAAQSGFSGTPRFQDVPNTQLFQDVVLSGNAEIVDDLSVEPRWSCELPGVSSMLIASIASPNRCMGVLVIASDKTHVFHSAHRKHLYTMASVAGISLANAFNFESIQVLMSAMLQALAEAIDSRDPFTAGHSRRVAQLFVAFAYLLDFDDDVFLNVSFSENQLREIYYAGILHDIGKIGIREEVLTKDCRVPEKVLDIIRMRLTLHSQVSGENGWLESFEKLSSLNKAMNPNDDELEFVKQLSTCSVRVNGTEIPLLYEDECERLLLPYGNLTRDEREEIQRHPAESERILQHIPLQDGFHDLLTIIRQHHERLDGTGYPDGLSKEDILIQGRMLAIVDIYDAITQERHYKAALTRDEALRILEAEAKSGKLDKSLVYFFSLRIQDIEDLAEQVKPTSSFEKTL